MAEGLSHFSERYISRTRNCMQALSLAGLADSHDLLISESASPTTFAVDKSTCNRELPLCCPDIVDEIACFSERPARKSNPPYGGLLSLTNLLSAAADRAALDLRSTTTVSVRPPQWGSVGARRGLRGSGRGAVAIGGANADRNSGRKQAPSHGGLTRPGSPPATAGRNRNPVRQAGPDLSEVRGCRRWSS